MSNGMRSCAQGVRGAVIALQPVMAFYHKALGLLNKCVSTQRPVPILKAWGKRQDLALSVQFLDESVALARLRLARDGSGQMRFQRDFRFEFSDTGDNRRPGVVRMLGEHVEWVSLDGEWQPGRVASVTRLHD